MFLTWLAHNSHSCATPIRENLWHEISRSERLSSIFVSMESQRDGSCHRLGYFVATRSRGFDGGIGCGHQIAMLEVTFSERCAKGVFSISKPYNLRNAEWKIGHETI